MSRIILETGEEYTLEQIFSGGNRIIIPDLQRDYCWGDKAYDKEGNAHELVTGFVGSLIDLFNKDKNGNFTLGLIYGYEQPPFRIQLCDGQQRMTTLFLLLGMLNRKTDGKFQKYLISDSEIEEGDKEPTLQYAIRESTLFFLSDLVCEFFLKQDFEVKDVKHTDWYFKEYDLDASISSVIKALSLIEKRLNKESNFNFDDFGEFVVNRLHFLYYNMGNRAQGEETFVIINTTGEPLTPTENLKPIFVNNVEAEEQEIVSKLWEKWEKFFWNNRGKNETADKGFHEFFRWVLLLNTEDETTFKSIVKSIIKDEQININGLEYSELKHYFDCVEFGFADPDIFPKDNNWLAPEDKNTQIVWFRILPVIAYIKRFGKENKRNIIRLRRFFENMSRNGKLGRDIADMLPLAVRVIKTLPSADIASIIEMDKVSETLLTIEERLKFMLYKDAHDRNQLEDVFWKEEDHRVWNGEIKPILEWSGMNIETQNVTDFNFELFKKYSDVFSFLFHDEMEYREMDITRRALLTRDLNKYPRIFNGYTNFSFCWKYSDWKELINDNSDKFKLFFDELLHIDESRVDEGIVYAKLEEMIRNNPSEKEYDEFVKIPELLSFCGAKNIQWDYEQQCWILIESIKRSGPHANIKSYRLFLDLQEKKFWDEEIWESQFYKYEKTCCVFEYKGRDTVIDVLFRETINGTDTYELQLFKRNGKERDGVLDFVAESCNLKWTEEPSNDYFRYESDPLDKEKIIKMIREMKCQFDNIYEKVPTYDFPVDK